MITRIINMFILVVCCIIDLLIATQCSEVQEIHKYVQTSQRNMTKYCTKIGKCEAGTHVACAYSGQSTMGPKCDSSAKPIKLTKGIQTHLLSTVNGIRKRLSQGIETGDNKEILPRAYGMIQLQWDQELADLAQLWANQCQDGRDKCRSTEKFPNVAQTDYSFISSYSKRRRDVLDSWANNLTANKLEKIIDTSINYWRRGMESVTRKMILSSKIFLEYLQMVHGQNTHMGCGMVTYTSNSSKNKTQNPSHRIVKLVCNWSHQLESNSIVYDIDPPQGRGGGGRSQNCGCYSGQTEGDGCLCMTHLRTTTTYPSLLASLNLKLSDTDAVAAEADCNSRHPTVVLMPVFTFEDGHDIPLKSIRNATAGYFGDSQVHEATKRYYNGGPKAREIQRLRPFIPTPPITGRHMMFERVSNQETIRPKIRNAKSRDMSRMKELVQEYLVSNKQVIHTPLIPIDSVDTIRQSSAAKMSRVIPVEPKQPVSYDYTGYFENSAKPRTRRVSFSMQDSNYYKTPDIRNMNENDFNKLLITLLEELVYHGNVNDIIAKVHDTHANEAHDYHSLFRSSKPMRHSNLIDNLERYEDEARRDDNIYSNVDYGHVIADTASGLVWPTIRKQNPLTHTAYDYYTNDYDFENEKIIRNIERDILQSNLDKENKYLI